MQSDQNKNKDNSKKVKYFYLAVPGTSVRAKNDKEEAFVSFSELSNKNTKKIKISSNKKKPTPYKIDYYHYTGDNREKKSSYKHSSGEKHKRSKSQTISSVKGRKGNSHSINDTSSEEMSYLLQQHLQNNKTSYNLVNEYLENPGKASNITVVNKNSHSESKSANRSRGKRLQNVGNNGLIKAKRTQTNNANMIKKIAFKSFDKRRAGTKLERREGSLDDPLSFLRSSSAWNKYTFEKQSAGKKSNRTTKTGHSKKQSKMRNSGNAGNYSKIAPNNAMWRFMKSNIR